MQPGRIIENHLPNHGHKIRHRCEVAPSIALVVRAKQQVAELMSVLHWDENVTVDNLVAVEPEVEGLLSRRVKIEQLLDLVVIQPSRRLLGLLRGSGYRHPLG